MANMITIVQAEAGAVSEQAAGTYVVAHAAFNSAGVPIIRGLLPVGSTTATFNGLTGGGCWDEVREDPND